MQSDLRHLHAIAGRDTKVVIDDIAMSGPGSVLSRLNSTGVLVIDELYGPFAGGHVHNPCMRAPDSDATRGRTRRASGEESLCPDWGFAIARFAHPASARPRGGRSRRGAQQLHRRRGQGWGARSSLASNQPTLEKANAHVDRASWTLQAKANCFIGHGAIDVAFGDDPADILTIVTDSESMQQACMSLCVRRAACTAITVPRYFGSRRQHLSNVCFLRANVTLPSCARDGRYDTWVSARAA